MLEKIAADKLFGEEEEVAGPSADDAKMKHEALAGTGPAGDSAHGRQRLLPFRSQCAIGGNDNHDVRLEFPGGGQLFAEVEGWQQVSVVTGLGPCGDEFAEASLNSADGIDALASGLALFKTEHVVADEEFALLEKVVHFAAHGAAEMVGSRRGLTAGGGGPLLDVNVGRDEKHAGGAAEGVFFFGAPGEFLGEGLRENRSGHSKNEDPGWYWHGQASLPGGQSYTGMPSCI